MSNTVRVALWTDRILQKKSEAKGGVEDPFTKSIAVFVQDIARQLCENRVALNLADGFTEDDVVIIVNDRRKNEYSNVGDIYIELVAALERNGKDARIAAVDSLIKIVRQHFKESGIEQDLRVSANIIMTIRP